MSTRRPNTVAVIQARMRSTRLPGKVMKEILGKPMLELMLERVRGAKTLDAIVIATGDHPANRPIIALAERLGCPLFVGSEEDVLDRYYRAARKFHADPIVRLTGDCPLYDPRVIDTVVAAYGNGERHDYVSNVNPPYYPDGLDTCVFSFSTLERAWKEATLPSEREHVCPYMWKHPELFRIGHVGSPVDYSNLRLTVDDEDDFALVRAVFEGLYPKDKRFSMENVLVFLKKHPELGQKRRAGRDEGYQESLKSDRVSS